jgi:hypothetical protein
VRTTVNPGSRLELEGSFELGRSLAETEAVGRFAAPTREVTDRESGKHVYLADLLRSFLEDPEEKITGPIRITIEPLAG